MTVPYWLRLARSGTTFTAQTSVNGTSWTTLGSSNLTGFASTALWGLAVTAHNNALANAATFDNLTLLRSAPVLSPIANQSLIAGQTLTVTNTASDPNAPPLTLTFSLLTAPNGMILNATNGILTWRPIVAQSPTTNSIIVQVSDNSTPPVSATQSFVVTVTQPASPTFSVRGYANGIFSMLVNGSTGPDYYLQSATNLNPPITWLPGQTNLVATPPFTVTDPVTTNFNQKFYRVLLGP